jgi:hypothetical protein
MKIPAASIDDIDIEDIQRRFPLAAGDIARLGHLLATGNESESDFLTLVNLLNSVGQQRKAEELLRINVVTEGDEIHHTYVHLFGHQANDDFRAAISAFSQQFDVSLAHKSPAHFLKLVYSSRPMAKQQISDPNIAIFLRESCEIEFDYQREGTMADITSEIPELFEYYLILQYTNVGWEFLRSNTK